MSEKVITKHQQDAVALGSNTVPVPECGIHATTIKGQSCKALDVPILGCTGVWLRVQKEAEAWIAPGGKLIEDNLARNRRINQAYAQLWKEDKRFQWAGLAAFASKQVGCGLLHAADNIKKSRAEVQEAMQRVGSMSNTDAAAVSMTPSTIGAGSAYMYRQLALGNTLLFLDIYPLHRFYMLRGIKQLETCLESRHAIKDQIIWPVDSKKISFGVAHTEILESFRFIDVGRIADSVKKMALHEQVNILQMAIYNDLPMQAALRANQFSWATGFPTGVAAEIQLTLSSECRTLSSSQGIWFPKDKRAKLYDKDQRMKFVNQAADQFNILLNSSGKTAIQASIDDIATNGAAR